jgi:hypothetical protein
VVGWLDANLGTHKFNLCLETEPTMVPSTPALNSHPAGNQTVGQINSIRAMSPAPATLSIEPQGPLFFRVRIKAVERNCSGSIGHCNTGLLDQE